MSLMRDDFPESVKRQLAKRVGYRCSNPDCRQSTSGPSLSTPGAVNMGVAAHITAASPGGARYDVSLTPEQRKSYDNGIWLCRYCGDLVDKDEATYPVDLLRAWKTIAEHRAGMEVHRVQRTVQDETAEHGPREDRLNAAKQIRSEFHEVVRSNRFENLDSSNGVLEISVIPSTNSDIAIDLSATEPILRGKLEPICASGVDYRRGSRFFGTVAMSHGGYVFDVTEFTDRGIILAANSKVLLEDSGDYRQTQDGDQICSI